MTILFVRNIEKIFGDRTIFTVQSLEIQGNDRIGIVGVNGAGKSTLLQILSKEIEPDEGTVSHHGSITIIPQFSEETLETATSLAKGKWHIANVSNSLSGGERTKVALAKVFLGNYNMLLLDEPTNYLDVTTQEELENMLQEYPGTVLFISHDRTFIRSVADYILHIDETEPRLFHGNYDQYMNRTEQTSVNTTEQELLRLQTKLTEIISPISMPDRHDDVTILEQEYEQLLEKIRNCKDAL